MQCEWLWHKVVQGHCMVSIESGKDGDSWSRDGFVGGLLVNRRLEQGSWQSPALPFGKAVWCSKAQKPKHAVSFG